MYNAIYVSRKKRSKTQTYASVPSVIKGGGGEVHDLISSAELKCDVRYCNSACYDELILVK